MHSRQKELQRGAFVNALGVVGKMAGPAFLVLVTRLYGPDAFGVFITAAAMVEMALAFLTAGFKDGALIFVARHADDERERPMLYQSLANALGWSLLLSFVLIGLALTVAPSLIPSLYEEYGDRLLFMLQWMTLALPFLAFERIVMAATQGLKIMKYEALINGGARPVLLLATAFAFWFAAPDERGLTAAYMATQAVIAILSAAIYHRELAWRPLGQAVRTFRLNREMLSFALPQNLNRTLERFITSIDVIMLGMFGASAAAIGLYGAGALIVRELRQIKLIFSSAFAPHIPRLYREQNLDELSRMFAVTSRWIATATIPVLLAVAVLKDDLLRLVHPEFAAEETLFMLFLLPIPYFQCSVGLAGNIVVMTGHSRFNLFNSVSTGTTNVLLNLWMIPLFGPVGAAAASALAALLNAVLELVEMRLVVGARLAVRKLIEPHLAGWLTTLIVGLLLVYTTIFDQSVAYRAGLVGGAVLLYGLLLIALLGQVPRLPAALRKAKEA